MAGTKLDPIDRMILKELQDDGRMTNVELASRVGISAPPCLRRVRTLEENHLIRGYHADVNPRELGFEVQVFAMVGLAKQAEADLTRFEARCRAWPLVRECHMLNGEVDFVLKCVAPDLSTFQTFLTEELTARRQCGVGQDLAGDPLRQGRTRRALRRAGSAAGEIRLSPVELSYIPMYIQPCRGAPPAAFLEIGHDRQFRNKRARVWSSNGTRPKGLRIFRSMASIFWTPR